MAEKILKTIRVIQIYNYIIGIMVGIGGMMIIMMGVFGTGVSSPSLFLLLGGVVIIFSIAFTISAIYLGKKKKIGVILEIVLMSVIILYFIFWAITAIKLITTSIPQNINNFTGIHIIFYLFMIIVFFIIPILIIAYLFFSKKVKEVYGMNW